MDMEAYDESHGQNTEQMKMYCRWLRQKEK